jgi:hypothetical protein
LLEVVVEEQEPDGFPTDSWDQPPLDGLFHHQPHGPASAAFWRITANHRAIMQLLLPFLLVESAFQPALLVSVANFAIAYGGNPWRTDVGLDAPYPKYASKRLRLELPD